MSCSVTGDNVGFRLVQSPSTEVHIIPQDLGVVWFSKYLEEVFFVFKVSVFYVEHIL